MRVLGQDSGGNVNAGWYLISAKAFGMHFLRYVLELFEIYGPTGVWGQNVIQEALLVVMRGEPPHLWSYSIPCSGEKLGVLPRRVLADRSHLPSAGLSRSRRYTNSIPCLPFRA